MDRSLLSLTVIVLILLLPPWLGANGLGGQKSFWPT